ncbi:MAG: energy-coupling factor transporter transmembrane protein EcfT [Chloroflexi bacterium]|nr:energy-coupling factor transporter transmembrane protein EcfT [Chloroflexota bacterium]
MISNTDLYVERASWVHGIDPRVKLIYVILGIVTILLFQNVFVILLGLLVAHLVIFIAQVPGDRVVWVWRRMIPLNILIPLLITLFHPEGAVLLEIGFLRLTWMALLRGVALALRLDCIAFIVFSWVFTTDQTKIVRSLVKLGLPYNAGLVLAISLRYIPMFYGLFSTVSEAQQARALNLAQGRLPTRLKKYIPILVAMMISALRTSDKLARALESRALGAEGVRRTVYRDIACRPVDYILLGMLVLAFAVILYLRLVLGVGANLIAL